MTEIIDNNTLTARFVFPGNLKISVSDVHKLPNDTQKRLVSQMETFKDAIFKTIKSNQNQCYKFPLDKHNNLYIDFRNNKLNLFIEDKKDHCYKQLLSAEIALKIEKKEAVITSDFKNYLTIDNTQKKENNLVSTLIHSAYESKINNRGSPTVFGKTIDDDFDLDL